MDDKHHNTYYDTRVFKRWPKIIIQKTHYVVTSLKVIFDNSEIGRVGEFCRHLPSLL